MVIFSDNLVSSAINQAYVTASFTRFFGLVLSPMQSPGRDAPHVQSQFSLRNRPCCSRRCIDTRSGTFSRTRLLH